MITLTRGPVYLVDGIPQPRAPFDVTLARRGTIAASILAAHNVSADPKTLSLRFDALVSHDITYVGIIQTARASGMTEFPLPYAMTNCHNSLCAVGGTINEDYHVFGLSAAKKYGGIFVPANQSVIHSFAREALSGCGKMILGSDSHTRYGALGTMGVGEGGPELVKQLLRNTYDIPAPEVILVYVTGKPKRGIGPHDVAIALVGATFQNGFVKNKILEFVGPGLKHLSADFRCGVDVMTTETTCLSSIWETDDEIRRFYEIHGRPEAFRELHPAPVACYDGMITIDLDRMESMIALPFHPSNACTIHEFVENAPDLLANVEKEARKLFPRAAPDFLSKYRDGRVRADQGIIAGCAGGIYENIDEAADILAGASIGDGAFSLSVYPTSVPVSLALTRNGDSAALLAAGALIKPSFCGPCFGAGDVPANNGFSLRHTTRNFPNREGSKPGEGQLAAVALMDARSIAATAANGGVITAATDVDYTPQRRPYAFDASVYEKRVYRGFGRPQPETPLVLGPNITDWPTFYALPEHLLVRLAAVIRDPVTTTDELIPSGETSSYRSNPLRLSEFALSRRVPEYVARSKACAAAEAARRAGQTPDEIAGLLARLGDGAVTAENVAFGSAIFANKPGDGSAREQAASCQRVLGGMANFCREFATKRYRSNCINWGILPFTIGEDEPFPYEDGDVVCIPNVRARLAAGEETYPAVVLRADGSRAALTLTIRGLGETERQILLDGCLMNWYRARG